MSRKYQIIFLLAVVITLQLVLLGLPGVSSAQIYWTGNEGIKRANLDGTNIETIVPDQTGDHIGIDTINEKIYVFLNGVILGMDMDGGNIEVVVDIPDLGFGVNVGNIAYDFPGNKAYWTADTWGGNFSLNGIMRANLDGSDIETIVGTSPDPLHVTNYALELDLINGKMYWKSVGNGGPFLRANLDGSNVETLPATDYIHLIHSGHRSPGHIDGVNSQMYRVAFPNTILHTNLADGFTETILPHDGHGSISDTELDLPNGKFYFIKELDGHPEWINSLRRMNLDGSNVEDLIPDVSGRVNSLFVVSQPTAIVTLKADITFGAPGDTVRVPLKLDNQTTSGVGGLQTNVILSDTLKACFVGLEDTNNIPGFTVSSVPVADTLKLTLFSISGDSIAPNLPDAPTCIATLVYVIKDPATTPGSTTMPGDIIDIDVRDAVVGDTQAMAMGTNLIDGQIQVGTPGDITMDDSVDILDVILLVDQILDDTAPTPGTPGFSISDVNMDGSINVADVIGIVNLILGPPPSKAIAGGSAVVNLGTLMTLDDGSLAIPVLIDTESLVTGAQATFSFDPTALSIGTPQLDNAIDLIIDSRIMDGTLRVMVYSLSSNRGIATGTTPMLLIPVTPLTDGNTTLTLSDLLLADGQAQLLPVQLGNTTQTVGKTSATPDAFTLQEARPNPFNPSTTISYEVPQQSHITLTVYNMLGQEVVRLVDQVQAPGRYQAVWNARNMQGLGVASGVYIYRLSSRTGFTETKRVTLLK